MIRRIDHAIAAFAGVMMVMVFALATKIVVFILNYTIELAIVGTLVYAAIKIFNL